MANTPLDEIFTFIITPHEIENTPSRADGIDAETEDMLRMTGCEMIQEAGILLKLYVAPFTSSFLPYMLQETLRAITFRAVHAVPLFLIAPLTDKPPSRVLRP